jgi:hypothetical protein
VAHDVHGWSLIAVSHGRRQAAAHAAVVSHDGWGFFVNFVNGFKWKNCKDESCVSRKVMKLCSLQLFHLMPFRVLKSNLYSARYNMRRKETEYGHTQGWSSAGPAPKATPWADVNFLTCALFATVFAVVKLGQCVRPWPGWP